MGRSSSSSKNGAVPPSRIEPIAFPVFAMSWWVNPSNGYSRVAYAGGGGSARTGVVNQIVVRDNLDKPVLVSTGTSVGIAMKLYINPISNNQYMMVAMENTIRRYKFPLQPPTSLVDGTSITGSTDSSIYSNAPYDVLCVQNHTELTARTTTDGSQQQQQQQPPTRMTINAIAVNSMASLVAVGCEDSSVYIYKFDDDLDLASLVQPTIQCLGHTAPICSVAFSLRNDRLVSAAKDGFARVWTCNSEQYDVNDQSCVAVLPCSIDDDYPKISLQPSDPSLTNNDNQNGSNNNSITKRKPPAVLVRGCSFADIDGNVVITVASGRRGKAFVYRWIQQGLENNNNNIVFTCNDRNECSPVPVSSMSLSDDGMLLSLGSVHGSITLWDVLEWKFIRTWNEVHELPVMCVCSRPYAVPVLLDEVPVLNGPDGDDTNLGSGIPIHSRSASADGKMSCLTLLRTIPKRKNGSKGTDTSTLSSIAGFILYIIHRSILLLILIRIFYPVIYDARKKCFMTTSQRINDMSSSSPPPPLTFDTIRQCLLDDFLIAPSSRSGISSPLY